MPAASQGDERAAFGRTDVRVPADHGKAKGERRRLAAASRDRAVDSELDPTATCDCRRLLANRRGKELQQLELEDGIRSHNDGSQIERRPSRRQQRAE